MISLATHSYKDKRIGLNCTNVSTWQLTKSIFDSMGAETFVIHTEPVGLNIN